jgi:hypothetical protein
MKRFYLIIWTLALTASLCMVFTTCKKDSNDTTTSGGEEPGGEEPGDDEDITINATDIIIKGSDSNLKTVKGIVYGDNNTDNPITIASCKYANKSFKLDLPDNINKHLYEVSFDEDNDIVISDPKAKWADLWISGYDDDDNEVGGFGWGSSDNEYNYYADYYYADKNFTVKGTETHTYELSAVYTFINKWDCSIKKGWNIVYRKVLCVENENGTTWTSTHTMQKPAGVTFEWSYIEYPPFPKHRR